MKPRMHLVEIGIITLSKVTITYQNYEQPPQTSQNSDFQSHFYVMKIGRIFPKKHFCEEYRARQPTFINSFFKNFDF